MHSHRKCLLPLSCSSTIYPFVCLSICPFVCLHVSTWLTLNGFLWNIILRIFKKSVKKIQIQLKLDKNSLHFMWTPKYILMLLATLNYHTIFCFTQKAYQAVSLSICPFTCINEAPTEWIYVKVDARDFYENMSRNSKFG